MSGRRLYIGRVGSEATRKDLEDLFGPIGTVVETRLMSGFAFVEYAELKDAEEAVSQLSGKDFMGERLIVEFAKPPRSLDERPRFDDRRGPPGGYGDRGGYDRGGYGAPPRFDDRPRGPRPSGGGHRLVVLGVPEGCSWQDLKDFARGAGTVTFADVDRDGKGYIEYPSRGDADEAIRTLSNTALKGSNVTIEDAAPGAGPVREDFRRPPPRDPYYDDRRGGYGGGGGGYRDDRGGYDRPPPRDYRRDERDYPRRDDRDRRDDRRGDDRDSRRDERRSRSPVARRSPPPADERERERSPVRERSPARW